MPPTISARVPGSGTLAGGTVVVVVTRIGILGVPPVPGGKVGGVPPPLPEVGIKYKGMGRNAAGGNWSPGVWAIGPWVVGAGVLAAGGGAVRDETRSTGCAGNGTALRNAAAEATQAAVANACGSFSQAARVPCQARHVQVTRSNTIMRKTRAFGGQWHRGVWRGPEG